MLFIFILDYRNGRQKANLSDFFKFKFIMGCKTVETAAAAAAKMLQSCPTLRPHGRATHQAPLSSGFSRQEYWSGLPFPSPAETASNINNTFGPETASEHTVQ